MTYAQVEGGQKLHLVYEPGEGPDDQHITRAGFVSAPLCGRSVPNGYRMTINVPLANACKNCIRIYNQRAGQVRDDDDTERNQMSAEKRSDNDPYWQEIAKGHPCCANCGVLIKADGFDFGFDEGSESKAANLKCGCRYCWHCSDNRGRHEGHDPNCTGPNEEATDVKS